MNKMNSSSNVGLYEFLIEAELQHYYNSIKNDLKVQNVSQLKYVTEDDLHQVGMSKPEIRRLKKFFNKHHPQTYLAKMKKMLLSKREDSLMVASLSSSSHLSGRTNQSVAPIGRHIIQADSIVIAKTLGQGEFGVVQQGVWTSDDGQRIQVAIKCLSQERMENNFSTVEFLKEAAIMHNVDHTHIVRLYGVVLDTNALMLVTELAPLRSLLECLKEPSMRPNLSVTTLYDFAIQINEGMQYLEAKRLIHRDLAARNILVFSSCKVKISDFGLSRALGVGKDYYQTNFNVNLKLPIAWCAPECINFLRFTSASDTWAFGVTLWEMFTYGFQPWTALTGQQILEAIDEPNYQRLEKPECCPNDIYYQIMLKCWLHEPGDRPTFAQLSNLLPENKPENVQAIRDFTDARNRKEFLSYEAGELVTVLDKMPVASGNEDGIILWKGVLKSGKTGLFHPSNTITYLGSSLPCIKSSSSPFHRSDSKSSSMRKGKISADMISGPQGDLKHTGHVGADGQFFGDITFLGSKCWVPKQVVTPYKPEPICSTSSESNGNLPSKSFGPFSMLQDHAEPPSNDTAPLLSSIENGKSRVSEDTDHEYHEISDEENELPRSSHLGLSNPALSSRSTSPLDSPRFDMSKSFDMGGPSLMDEVFSALQDDITDETNVRNELREMARTKKKFATVKPISSSDRRQLDNAIAIANELASRSMLDLDRPGKHSHNGTSLDDISSPATPNSPTHKRKFTFSLGGKNDKERRNYSQEAQSIPDIQYTLTEEAKEAYNSLIDKPNSMGSMGFLTPSFENKSTNFNFPEKCSSKKFDPEFGGACGTSSSSATTSNNVKKLRNSSVSNVEEEKEEEEEEENPLRLLRLNKTSLTNVLPLPPRERGRVNTANGSAGVRHQRKHPLLFPTLGKIQSSAHSTSLDSSMPPPPPPPKPQRANPGGLQKLETNLDDEKVENQVQTTSNTNSEEKNPESQGTNTNVRSMASSFERGLKIESKGGGNDVPLYENYDNLEEVEGKEEEKKPNSDQVKDVKEINTIEKSKNNSFSSISSHSSNNGNPRQIDKNFNSCTNSPGSSSRNSFEYVEPSKITNKPPPIATRRNYSFERELERPSSSSFMENCPEMNLNEVNLNAKKVQTIKRVLGSSTKESDCEWALNATSGDSAHAVKLLRLSALLPESLLKTDLERVISVLEMSHWDVIRASEFLLSSKTPKGSSSRNSLTRAAGEVNGNTNILVYSSASASNNISNDYVEPTTDMVNAITKKSSSTELQKNKMDFIRPTRV